MSTQGVHGVLAAKEKEIALLQKELVKAKRDGKRAVQELQVITWLVHLSEPSEHLFVFKFNELKLFLQSFSCFKEESVLWKSVKRKM